MTTKQRIRMLGVDTYNRLQGWRKRGSLYSSKWHNGHEVAVKKLGAKGYEISVDGKVKAVAGGRENARLLATRYADLMNEKLATSAGLD